MSRQVWVQSILDIGAKLRSRKITKRSYRACAYCASQFGRAKLIEVGKRKSPSVLSLSLGSACVEVRGVREDFYKRAARSSFQDSRFSVILSKTYDGIHAYLVTHVSNKYTQK